jgi:hypothetical protein
MRDPYNIYDKRCDLPSELNKVVKGNFDAVAFTHADRDHIKGFSEYFYLEYDSKYQSANRKKINDLWVPAAVILETNLEFPEAEILRAEARYRLKNKSRIKVFSKPQKLKDWLKKEGIPFEDVAHLIVDAGKTIPGWTLKNQGIEFFVHSPFATSIDGREIERNECCLILQATFNNTANSKFIFGSDAGSDMWNDIVDASCHFGNQHRLEWDVFHISHHSSYRSLNKDDRGKTKTTPTKQIKWLFEEQGHKGCKLVSPSDIKHFKYDEKVLPHQEAINYYEDVAIIKGGEYVITMEHPAKDSPKPLVIKVEDYTGVTIEKAFSSIAFVTNKPAPRAG